SFISFQARSGRWWASTKERLTLYVDMEEATSNSQRNLSLRLRLSAAHLTKSEHSMRGTFFCFRRRGFAQVTRSLLERMERCLDDFMSEYSVLRCRHM